MPISSLSLTKTGLKSALAEALYNEIISGTNNYYYFIGKTLDWMGNSDTVEEPLNTLAYDNETRREMIFLKKITSADISFIIPRYDWVSGQVYDMYDDKIGHIFTTAATADGPNHLYLTGTFNKADIAVGNLVTGDGIDADTFIDEVTATQITLTKRTVGAVTSINVITRSTSGEMSLETSPFYVITNDRNVYKCLDNNGGAPSTVKPYSTTHETVSTSDGYIWKFMYTVPNSLVNKFMTLDDIPVTTSVKSAFYSQGSIYSVNVVNYGSGYTNGDYLIVLGDGFQKNNPYRIVNVVIDNPGAGYVLPPAVVVSPPFDSTPFASTTTYLTGQYISNDELIYEVVSGGISGVAAPTYTGDDTVANGTMSVKFVGLKLSISTSLTANAVSSIAIDSMISSISVSIPGSGYNPDIPPNVVISGNGIGATATAVVSPEGRVIDIHITNRGAGYTTASVSIAAPTSGVTATAMVNLVYGYGYSTTPVITVAAPFVANLQWSAGATVTNNQIVQANSIFYRVTSSGSKVLGTTAPIHLTGTEVNGTADLLFIGNTATMTPTVELTKAQIAPIIESGQIIGATVSDPGIGYTTSSIVVSGTGTGAELVPNVAYGDLNTRQANTELLAVPGTIDAIKIVNPGLDYTWANVTIEGDGQDCTAVATVTQGAITKITITNPGFNYTVATVTITGNNEAIQAYARPIIAPPKGHGKNAIKELFARDLSMSSTIARDRNQGYVVENDYRQLGIIKNPSEFGSVYRYNGFAGYPCFSVYVTLITPDTTRTGLGDPQFQNDDVIHNTNGAAFQVVSAEVVGAGWNLLVQATDNVSPVLYSNLTYATNGVAKVQTITPPNVDKYSGDILFIDNRASFQPTDDQTISIKTAIRL
jgi:hypothetical protein